MATKKKPTPGEQVAQHIVGIQNTAVNMVKTHELERGGTMYDAVRKALPAGTDTYRDFANITPDQMRAIGEETVKGRGVIAVGHASPGAKPANDTQAYFQGARVFGTNVDQVIDNFARSGGFLSDALRREGRAAGDMAQAAVIAVTHAQVPALEKLLTSAVRTELKLTPEDTAFSVLAGNMSNTYAKLQVEMGVREPRPLYRPRG